ncbi:type II toxin-antitoxin system HicB family antitoxin [Pelagibacterium lentulum]|uniref:HicB family protein n=1 Tax=Pelagibacterium lentulum TaxID=2029865 RepID=A0A916VWU8_9HYPH|nr:type II toxin-antitoxin system HicB family antitoxin [Pelagibacterium lentulum]GGA45966.1 HicB family protein [Pelagibacterium lentulum]
MAKHYVLALLHKEDGAYGISFPDYPGVISGGTTFNDAVNRGANTLVFHLQSLAEDGLEIQLPRDAPEDAIAEMTEEEFANAMPALIEIDFPGKSVRVNVSIEEGLLGQIDNAARMTGESRSAFLARAARERLRA